MPEMRRRSDWAPDLPVKGEIKPEEVKFLLVHHTAEPDSNYEAEDVEPMLRQIYGFHTGADKAWPDIAYNFFVDKFGRIWEARTGSADGPVRGDATGGNQGFSQLCCFLGDFELTPPPQAAVISMIALLTWLADRYGLDMTPDATTTFTSLGSNLHPSGSEVSTKTISTHRQMSQTTCPGTACHELVTSQFQALVSQQLSPKASTTSSIPATQPSVTSAPAPDPTEPEAAPDSSAAPTETKPSPRSNTSKPSVEEVAEPTIAVPASGGGGSNWPIALGASSTAAVAAGALGYGLWSKSRSAEPDRFATAAPGPTVASNHATPGHDTATVPTNAEFIPLVDVADDEESTATTVNSPVVWWRPGAPAGTAGVSPGDGVLVFWLAGAGYSEHNQERIQSSMRSSLDRLGSTAGLRPGPWFTQILSTILPGLAHPANSGLVLGLATSAECLALTVGNARVEVPGLTGNHKPRPSLPGIDPRSGMAHRWGVPEAEAWFTGWLGGPGTLSVHPRTVGESLAGGTDAGLDVLGNTDGYLGVRLDR